MKLFLSHASEDKDFVRQLYDRLVAEGFEVWLDERKLKLGDSLLGKINEGLLESDYGVVVLSPTFFGKKWTHTELSTLMALETATKKMILPIWKDLAEEQIKDLMPTLADRVAVNANAGIEVVVQAVISAVGGAEHQRSISKFDQIKARFDKMGAASKARRDSDIMLSSLEGAKRVRNESIRFGQMLLSYFSALSSDELKFTTKQIQSDTYNVQGPKRYGIEAHFHEGSSIDATYNQIYCIIYRLGDRNPLGERGETRRIKNLKYYPYFDNAGIVVWSPTEKREETIRTEDLVALLAEMVADLIARG